MKTNIRWVLFILIAAAGHAQDRLPIIDVHVHALGADAQGPPPLGMCTPIKEFPTWDPAQPYGATFRLN